MVDYDTHIIIIINFALNLFLVTKTALCLYLITVPRSQIPSWFEY